MTPFQAYQLYTAMKLHFTTNNYDYIKYCGKTGASFDSFNRRKDKFHYNKLANQKDPTGFVIANFISGSPPKWIGDLNTEEARERYTEYLKRTQSLTYRFDSEIRRLGVPLAEKFKVKKGQHPTVLELYRRGEISIESLVILNDMLKFFPIWDKKIQDPILWPEIRQKCLKYQPFLYYDKVKIKEIICDVLAEV